MSTAHNWTKTYPSKLRYEALLEAWEGLPDPNGIRDTIQSEMRALYPRKLLPPPRK